ncbi:MAG: hypothetical protein HY360_09510 [Verrucomicrobia bacterium]|nr:hypothetical protein [Verrucomicrobiota bacterium]
MKTFPRLETSDFVAYIADNSPLGIHRRGYNGVASLIPKATGNNLFVPTYAGLNYETIGLTGLPPYAHAGGSKFEPRCEAMRIEDVDAHQVVLAQPETSHAHVSARITFRVEEPCRLLQRIEIVFHRRFCADQEKNSFYSLWASYILMPPDRHVYTKLDPTAQDQEGWVGVTKEDHQSRDYLIRPLPADRELQAAEHLELMMSQPPLAPEPPATDTLSGTELRARLNSPLSFYYGFCHDDLMLLAMFRQPERFRFAYSPCGAGKEPAWNPAWDYVLYLEDAQLEQTYTWDLCIVVKEYRGRADVMDEVRRYHAAKTAE